MDILSWGIIAGLSLLTGVSLISSGFYRLLRMRLTAAAMRLLTGSIFASASALILGIGLNLQTYDRLVYEQNVAYVSFEPTDQPGVFIAVLELPADKIIRVPGLKGDEFSMGAQVISFPPAAQLLGYDSVFRLEYIEGRYRDRYTTDAVSEAVSTGLKLSEDPWLDVHALAEEQGERFGLLANQSQSNFGSAVYAPMSTGLEYEISLTQTAFILRERTRGE
ncbi:MAG: hypothetical protein ACPH4G_08395 [Henriciella sp.]